MSAANSSPNSSTHYPPHFFSLARQTTSPRGTNVLYCRIKVVTFVAAAIVVVVVAVVAVVVYEDQRISAAI